MVTMEVPGCFSAIISSEVSAEVVFRVFDAVAQPREERIVQGVGARDDGLHVHTARNSPR